MTASQMSIPAGVSSVTSRSIGLLAPMRMKRSIPINKTSSAVRLIHEPTGIVAECQTERSQTQNREYAMRLLKSRIYEQEKAKQDAELANERKSQVGSGDRSEKIRTYNYPQGRITDHRIGMSIYQMENFLNGGLDEMIDNLIAADRAEKLKGE